ncbi:MAG TPA: elongation factor 1-beta [Candidatus Nanoarchaeia archaeon]|nr:elongation factor 1-beta [Candidatus Nanoarchaeia archaeon]
MGNMFITLKIMPISPDSDLEEIKKEISKILEEEKCKRVKFEEEPIAFGLNAIKTFFEMNEEQGLEPIEEKLKKVEEISSVQVTDMRRDFM